MEIRGPGRDTSDVDGAPAEGRQDRTRRLRARRIEATPRVAGRLDEPAWDRAEAATDFRQLRPEPGRPASFETEARLFYTDEAIYVGARMHDPAADSIIARLARRDVTGGSDRFAVAFDSYRDRRTAFVFMVSAAGVQMDLRLSDDTREDMTWDAAWESAVTVDGGGWTAELRVPLSQLRYTVRPEREDAGDWGLNVQRHVSRLGGREPATSYAVGGLIRDFREGRSAVGVIATATNRSVEDGDRMDLLPSAAYAGGWISAIGSAAVTTKCVAGCWAATSAARPSGARDP